MNLKPRLYAFLVNQADIALKNAAYDVSKETYDEDIELSEEDRKACEESLLKLAEDITRGTYPWPAS